MRVLGVAGDFGGHATRHDQTEHAQLGARVPAVVLPRRALVVLEQAMASLGDQVVDERSREQKERLPAWRSKRNR